MRSVTIARAAKATLLPTVSSEQLGCRHDGTAVRRDTFTRKSRLWAVAAVMAVAAPGALAESGNDSGPGTLEVDARVNFEVNVVEFLRFRVGSPGATVDTIVFDVDSTDLYDGDTQVVGNGNPVAGSGGDAAAGSGVNVQVVSTYGTVEITHDAGSQELTKGGGIIIPWSEIETSSNSAALDAPELSNSTAAIPIVAGQSADGEPTPDVGTGHGAISRTAVWTYAFLNTAVYEQGTYTATVTYTATAP
jgi:hypothetical protein